MTRNKTTEYTEFNNLKNSFLTPCTPWLILLAITLLSCQSAPKMADVFRDGRLPLEPGAYVYLLAEKDAIPVLQRLMFNNINSAQLQQMADRTRFAAAAAYVAPNGKAGALKPRYRLAAWGNYPASHAKMAMGSSKEWKKRRSPASGADYWYSPQIGYAVAVTGAMALVATAAEAGSEAPDPYSADPGTALPEGFAAFHKGSILSFWLSNPAPAINQKIKEMGIPIELPAEQVFVSLFPEDERGANKRQAAEEQRTAEEQRYVARLQIQVPSASHARGLTMMFAFARNFIPPQSELGILFANPPVQDENNLKIATAPLTVREIALLLKLFSL